MFIQNQVLDGTYQILQPIGQGGTSSVYLAYHLRLRKYVVIKQIKGKFDQNFLLRAEVDILKNLHHPALPQVYDFIQNRDSVYTVIDYVEGYDLDAYIAAGYRFSEENLKKMLHQIIEALAYLHEQKVPVLHSDIKPGNIILNSDGNATLIDFNISLGGDYGNLRGLTMPYAAPEQIEMARMLSYLQTPDFLLDGRSDIYSLGATFYELISGIRPTPGVQPAALRSMDLGQYSRDFLALIDRMMAYDREDRPKTARKLLLTLNRMDKRYRAYFAMRCASILLSAVLIGTGLFCYIRGMRQIGPEAFASQITAVTEYISAGHLDQAEALCSALTKAEDTGNYIQKDRGAKAQLYHALGDIYYYRGNYHVAVGYYQYAVENCDGTDLIQAGTYLRDLAIAYAENGNLSHARSCLSMAKSYYSDTNHLMLAELIIEARSGNTQQCLTMVEALIAQSDRKELCLRAVMCAATLDQPAAARIRWLERATEYGGGRTVQRRLAAAYVELAQQYAGGTQYETALDQALQIYKLLNDSEYASLEDRLNYGTVLTMRGDYQSTIVTLKNALEVYPDHYRILTDLCFTYNRIGDATQTSIYCAAAINAWKQYTADDKLGEATDTIQYLMEIGRRYGVGG